VVMPDTPLVVATRIAERIRSVMEAEAFPLDEQAACIPVTVSIGLAGPRRQSVDANPDALFQARRPGPLCLESQRPQPGDCRSRVKHTGRVGFTTLL
jgi:hypothetical protein